MIQENQGALEQKLGGFKTLVLSEHLPLLLPFFLGKERQNGGSNWFPLPGLLCGTSIGQGFLWPLEALGRPSGDCVSGTQISQPTGRARQAPTSCISSDRAVCYGLSPTSRPLSVLLLKMEAPGNSAGFWVG